ncbi:alpha-protein kinase 3 [Aulostomus maculatus]
MLMFDWKLQSLKSVLQGISPRDMGSRRQMSRSSSSSERSSNGEDINGSSRPGGCSYLSNVRPENRSTLCSVIAQLTEETQPSFETTLKSKAVSENCNVKFSCVVTGYPIPQVIWYKDDIQLDRYCGLPKYEIFRNGRTHSLHIYNCTVDDAAMYQASASNSKGIVSCSGVLEVGEMNEFKIHQRYFGKIKQKAENRRREVEGKENQEPPRTISPDRTQRKRRSTMEAFLSPPSSMEDEVNEESFQGVAVEAETRLQEPTDEWAEERPVPMTNGAASAVTNGQAMTENGSKDGTYIYDSAQKTFTAIQPQTPFVKKKIKISTGSKVAKADTLGEKVSEKKKVKEEASISAAPTCTPVSKQANSDEAMEVESSGSSLPVLVPVSRNVAEPQLKPAKLVEKLSKAENTAEKKQLTASVSLVARKSKNYTGSVTDGKQASKHEQKGERKHTKDNIEIQKQSPRMTSRQLRQCPVPPASKPPVIEDVIKAEDVRVMDVDERSDTSITGTSSNRNPETEDKPCESRIALPQRPCKGTRDHLPEKETSACQKNASVPRPVPLSEVTQTQTKTNRNDAPVDLQSPPDPGSVDVRETQKTPTEADNKTHDIQTPSVLHDPQAPIVKTTQEMWDHSRGSNETHTILFTDPQKSPLESPSGEDTQECNVSSTDQQSQVDTAIKSVEGTEIQVDERIDGNEVGNLLVQADTVAPNEKINETVTEIAAAHTNVQAEKENTKDKKDKYVIAVEESVSDIKKPIIKTMVENSSELQNKPVNLDTAVSHLEKPQNTNLTEKQIEVSDEIPKPVTRVISVAELLRSQIKALESTAVNAAPTVSAPTDFTEHPTKAGDKCQEFITDESKSKVEMRKSVSGEEKFPVIGADTPGISPQLIQQELIIPSPEVSPLVQRRNCVSPIPSATPKELASGARPKILVPKAKPEEATDATSLIDNQTQKEEMLPTSPVTLSVSPSLPRRSPLLHPTDDRSAPVEKRSPLLNRRKITSETLQAPSQQPSEDIQSQKMEGKAEEKTKHDPRKAPQIIRKIRGETFADASGHLKLWCQFFNILSDSTIKWYRNQVEIAQIQRNAADESQVSLAIVQASSKDSGVYKCTITNEYGTDSTDFLLSADTLLAGMSLREDISVGEEIEMTPLVFTKGVADSGTWGSKFFGRIMMQKSRIGEGCAHKVWRAKVIYGLEPVFESGNTCIIKACNPVAYGGKEERCLLERNLDFAKQECKIQNLAREYCKIFSAEARIIENFGPPLEIIPVYLMYRPANAIPYATVEADLDGEYQKYSALDDKGRIEMKTGSEVEQKCSALQHWIFQWTNGNLLLTQLEGVDTKITKIGITVKSTGHQSLPVEGNPKVFEQFVSLHRCNYFCGLLGLRSLKVLDSLMMPTKPKGSKSPLLQRKMAAGSSSPQTGRKSAGSPRQPRKAEQECRKSPTKQKSPDAPKEVQML